MPARGESTRPERILVLIAAGVVVFLFAWFQWRLLFLGFAGLLVSIFLHTIASWIQRRTPLNPLLAYWATLIAIVSIAAVASLLLAPRVITQASQAISTLPKSIAEAKAYMQRTPWGSSVLHVLQGAMAGSSARLPRLARDIVEGAVDLIVVLVIGFFGALNPRAYKEGFLSLFPPAHRPRARELTDEILATLRMWLFGQLIPMAVLAIGSMIGLWLLGVPLAFTVGLLTGALVFMPYVGSIGSGILAILLALQKSSHTALYVFLLYCVFHLIEGYLLTPFVQKRAVRLPPILTILAQFCLWSFGGFLGVAVAAPLAAAVLVVIKNLYLEERPAYPGQLPQS